MIVSRIALVCAAFTMPAAAFAEEAADQSIIVIGSSQSDAAEAQAAATPGGADVITYRDYADRSLVSLRDTLSFSPGVYTQPRFGQEVRISIRGSGISRGFHMRGLTLLQDGVPINLADDNGDFQELEPIFFDHLAVYRGANALRFGSGTLGGAINGVTPNGKDAPGLYARVDAGSFEMLRGLATIGGSSGAGDYWAGISADTANGDRDHAKRRSVRFNGNVGLKLGDAASTRFHIGVNMIEQRLPGALALDDVLTAPSKGNFNGDQQRNIKSLRLQNRTRFDWGATRLEIGLFANAKDLFHPIFQVIDQKSTDIGAMARLEHEAGPISLTLGGEIRRGRTRARQFVNVNGRRGTPMFDAVQQARTANAYAEARLKAIDGLSLIAGAIHADGFRKRRVRFSVPAGAQDGRLHFDALSPKFGLLLEPARDIQVYANYSRSAEFPGFGEVFQTVAGKSTLIPSIREQRAWTAEVGTRGKAGWATWDISLYRAMLKGEMLQYASGGNTGIPAATFNADRTLHQGVEAAIGLEPTPWLRLRQLWQYSDFRFRDDRQFRDNRLPVVPRHVLRSEVRIGGDALHLAPNLEWVPQGAWADYANTRRTPGYAMIGLTGGATVAEGVDVFVDARNLTGKKAAGDVSAVLDFSTLAPASRAIFYPIERRAVYAGVRTRF